jgi:hypothetical protein
MAGTNKKPHKTIQRKKALRKGTTLARGVNTVTLVFIFLPGHTRNKSKIFLIPNKFRKTFYSD